MEVVFNIGDKIYEKNYSKKDFLDMQLVASLWCEKNRASLESGEDENGYYIEIKDIDEHNVPFVLIIANKLEKLKEMYYDILSQPVLYNDAFYDCDDVSVMTMQIIAERLKRTGKRIIWDDAYGKEINDVGYEELEAVLDSYAERRIAAHAIYKELKKRLNNAKTVEEVDSITGIEFFDLN